jgi:hypothetical protein
VTTGQIYKGSIAFILLQLMMVAVVVAFPTLVVGSLLDTGPKVDVDKAFEKLMQEESAPPPPVEASGVPSVPAPPTAPASAEDPMRGLLDAVKEDQKKK